MVGLTGVQKSSGSSLGCTGEDMNRILSRDIILPIKDLQYSMAWCVIALKSNNETLSPA